jgi:hypothetical protein
MKKGDNMKDLNEYVNQLCEDLTQLKNTRWSHCAEDGAYYGVKEGRKYIKIVSYDDSNGGGASVWGFINKSNPKFKEGDVLLSAGWNSPALNKARGNLIDGYPVLKLGDRFMYGPGYCSGAIAGTPRDGGFV